MFGNQVSNHRQSSVISALSIERNFIEHNASNLLRRKTSSLVYNRKIMESSDSSSSSSGCLRRLQVFYEKSRLHYLLPILILILYSFLGGFIFYTIEAAEERIVLEQKKEYIEKEEMGLYREIQRIQQRTRYIFSKYPSLERKLLELRRYKPFAMNRLNKAVFWYVLQIYYLNDQESYKASLLHPNNPERIWRKHFSSNFGRIVALKNYTQQLSNRCWEIGVELVEPDIAIKRLKKSLDEFNRFTGLHQILMPVWTFWNSMFLAVTTYSTIGYGNITPKSKLGKLAAMLYAVVGIPLVLMILHKLGRFFLLGLEYFWNNAVWLMESINCLKNGEKLKNKMKHDSGMPVLLAVGVAFGWMFLCAAIFLQFEDDWDYFKSFYFFFCSLTTIGYGDVTPTRSEDMFLIFGFIIIGLSLVSMCINVIQLKLEELFEELLLSMMEEYGAQGAARMTDDLKPDLWKMFKMWKKSRQKRNQPQPSELEQQRKSLTEFNFWKIFPFSKRRREVLLQDLRNRLNQSTKSTQTDNFGYSLHTLNYVQELDEISWNGTPSTGNDQPVDTNSPNNMTSSSTTTTSSSSDKKVRVRVAVSENSSSSPTFLSSSSSSSYVRRYLPSRKSERRHTTFSNTTNTTFGGCSVQSAPTNDVRNISPHSAQLMEEYSATRRWTFFEIGKTPRGAPRGLTIPYMYLKQNAKTHETTEMKRLIAEIDSRLVDCRSLVSPCSRAVSRATSRASTRKTEEKPGTSQKK